LHHQQPEKYEYQQNFNVAPPEKISANVHGCTDFDLILGSQRQSVVLFGAITLTHSETIKMPNRQFR